MSAPHRDPPPAAAAAAKGAAPAAAPRTVAEMLALARPFLANKGIEKPRLEAELLVAHALGLSRLDLYLALDRPIAAGELEAARALLVRRSKGEPTAYLTGQREFYGRRFAVSPACLIPRPETELIVDLARAALAGRSGVRVADLGTGSGCLAITLALELDSADVVASDVSPQALELARANAQRLAARVEFHEGDGLAPLAEARPAGYALLVSNPPYVDPAERAALPREVGEHEPALALFAPAGQPDAWAQRLLGEGLGLLEPGGLLLVELGADQAARLEPWAAARGLAPRFHADLAGHRRVLELRRAS